MKRILFFVSLCAVFCFASTSRAAFASSSFAYADASTAQNVSGSWTAKLSTPEGNSFTLTFVFKQDGDKVTGNVQGPQATPLEISNGKVDGDTLTFDVSLNGVTINHEGKIDGDSIRLTTKSSDGSIPPGEVMLKREK